MNLYEKMFAVMNDSEAIEKGMVVGSGKNSYKAVSEAVILNMVKPLFRKYKLIIFPIDGEIKDHVMTWNKTDYNDKTSENLRAMTELKVIYRIQDIESKEFQDVVGFGNGSDSQDKGAGKASTYSLKNVLSKTFMLFSGEDTDNTHSDDLNKLDKVVHVITKDEAKNLLTIADKAGVTAAQVTVHLLAKFKLSLPSQLNKEQYNVMCKGYENMKKVAK